jgi:beta-glucosidase
MQLKSAAQWLLALPVRASSANDHHQQLGKRALATSDPFYPSPWMNPDADGWAEAYAQARDFVSQMTLMEKVNLTTGVG